MPKTEKISCIVWGRKGYGKTTLRENLAKEFGEVKDVTKVKGSLESEEKKNRTIMTVTSRAWFGITADTISSLSNSYPIKIEMKEIRNSWYSLHSDYYLRYLQNATVILYIIDSTARWELHEERPLFEKFLQIMYGEQRGPPLAVIFTKCDHSAAEAFHRTGNGTDRTQLEMLAQHTRLSCTQGAIEGRDQQRHPRED